MTEDFLYYIWQFKLFQNPLKTLQGEEVYVENPGYRNVNAGPDFLNARIKMGDVSWHGNVEIHVKTSDWHLHGHDYDPSYQKLILHLVYHHDIDKVPHDCPLVALDGSISEDLIENFKYLHQQNQFIPCENLFHRVDDFTKLNFVESLYVQRLAEKSKLLEQRWLILKGDWEALLFEQISSVFGLKINANAFEILAKSFPFKILQQINSKNENLEAFLFGQAGFLEDIKDDYQAQLRSDYQFLKHKYNTQSIENHLFKFLRLRPANFPTLRLAQLANLYQNESKLFTTILNSNTLDSLNLIFTKTKASDYWDQHYNFAKFSKKTNVKTLTQERINLIILNTIVPIRFFHAMQYGTDNVEDLLSLVRSIKPEQNSIIKNYKKIGANISNALEGQAYLELKKKYCDQKKCLDCRIGCKIINYVR